MKRSGDERRGGRDEKKRSKKMKIGKRYDVLKMQNRRKEKRYLTSKIEAKFVNSRLLRFI